MGTRNPGSIRRTKRLLSEALLALLQKHSFRKISVGDICEAAMVSRSAFYSHFADKYELLSQCMEESLRLQAVGAREQRMEEQIAELLTRVQENRRVLHNIFMADMNAELMEIFHKTLYAVTEDRLRTLERAGAVIPGGVSFTAEFLAGGMANVMICWIRENCAVPAEEIAGRLCALLTMLGAAEPGKKDG